MLRINKLNLCVLYFLVIFTTIVFVLSVVPQNPVLEDEFNCRKILSCKECIRTPTCVWCKDPKFTIPNNTQRNYARCNTLEGHQLLDLCSLDYLENLTYEMEISERSNNSSMEIRLSPENAKLSLRVGQKVNVTMKYFDTENKPLDLYYVMDLSATMADDKPKVATLGTRLARKISDLTSDVRIGFGSFIDKPILPFVSIGQLNKNETENTTKPYGFKNHLKLTTDIDLFKEAIMKAKVSGNLDAPEGGLDAIMQAVVCKDVIGWRPEARHLLILSTDGPFHIAGDGKLAGILKPNDGMCYMTKEKNVYTKPTSQDYPSINQINSKVKEENVFVIFAVTQENVQLYERLALRIEGSATRALKEDSDNVVELVEQEYKKIISSVELPKLPKSLSKFIRVTYYSKCTNESDFQRINKCQNLQMGSNATFQIELELIKCPRNKKDWKQLVAISPVGFAEAVNLNLSFVCECPCEHEIDHGYFENDPDLCQGRGTPRCGICECMEEYRGTNCQCSSAGTEHLDIDDSNCKIGNSTDVCSSRGACICGQCECRSTKGEEGQTKTYSGAYCECDDTNCPLGDDNLLCSGHGLCKCSKCKCDEFFQGDSCSCPTNDELCKEPGQNFTCSNKGNCACGKCICQLPYSGRLCQNCPNCPGKCDDVELLKCIQCFMDNIHNLKKSDCKMCDYLSKIESFDEVFELNDEEKSCIYTDEISTCESTFVYGYDANDRNKMYVRVERTIRCLTELPIIWTVVLIITTVLLSGLTVLLCWKLVTCIHDLKEVKKFEKERKNAQWNPGGNPIYKEATTEFRNPIYGSSIRRSTRRNISETLST